VARLDGHDRRGLGECLGPEVRGLAVVRRDDGVLERRRGADEALRVVRERADVRGEGLRLRGGAPERLLEERDVLALVPADDRDELRDSRPVRATAA
jgi:hypothetical protein